MGIDNDVSPREFDEFEAGIEAMVQHLLPRDPNDEVREPLPQLCPYLIRPFTNLPLEMDDRPNLQSTSRIRYSRPPSTRYIQNVRYALHDQRTE